MSGVVSTSVSVGTAWEKLFSFVRAFAVSSLAPSSWSWVTMDLEELRKLERTTRRILATLHDAEEHWDIQEESTKLRLRELKDLAYEIKGVLNEYEYEVGRSKLQALNRSTRDHYTGKRKRHEENTTYAEDTGVVQVPYEFVCRVRKIEERFNEIKHFSTHFSLSEDDGERCFAPDISDLRQTSSFLSGKLRIIGRDKEKDIIVQKLLLEEWKSQGSNISVLAIVGTGGLGKTTLAQLVYNDPRLCHSFDKHAWVYVSEQFDVNSISRDIINSLTKGECNFTELADLQQKLADEIMGKRILLVLDDVQNERGDCWDLLCQPMSAARICTIILTSRSEEAARLMQTMPSHRPCCLSFDDSWSLFKEVAFPDGQEPTTPSNLIEIGKKIVKRCKGLPLAVVTLGSMLRTETDEDKWVDVLENELLDLDFGKNHVMTFYKH